MSGRTDVAQPRHRAAQVMDMTHSALASDMAQEVKNAARAAQEALALAEATAAVLDARICVLDAALLRLRTAAERAGVAVEVVAPISLTSSRHMTREEFAAEMKVCVRQIDNDRRKMVEGTHYHRHGRRVIFHYPEAAQFVRTLHATLTVDDDLEKLAIDEVTQRRARRALKRLAL